MLGASRLSRDTRPCCLQYSKYHLIGFGVFNLVFITLMHGGRWLIMFEARMLQYSGRTEWARREILATMLSLPRAASKRRKIYCGPFSAIKTHFVVCIKGLTDLSGRLCGGFVRCGPVSAVSTPASGDESVEHGGSSRQWPALHGGLFQIISLRPLAPTGR